MTAVSDLPDRSRPQLERPFLTVVTVVRNEPELLARTLESVGTQDSSSLEHVIVDGASTDATATLALGAAVGSEHVRAWSEPDDGIYDAMNAGLRHSRGEYVLYLNAGDMLTGPSVVKQWREHLDEHPGEWLRTPVVFVDPDGNQSRPRRSAAFDPVRFSAGRQPVFHQGAAMGRELLIRLGGFDLDYPVSADLDLMVRAVRAGVRPVVLDRAQVAVDDGGASTQNWPDAVRETRRIVAAGAGPAGSARAAARMVVTLASVAGRRGVRQGAEAVLGRNRVMRWRGLGGSVQTGDATLSPPGAQGLQRHDRSG